MEKFKNLLTSTTLIPLWAKAVESVDKDPILQDRNALPMLRHFGYDLEYYSKKKQNPSQVGCCLRAKWIDDEILAFIKENGPCNVIQLGAGIDDRFRRIGQPQEVSRWYDLDLPEVAQMRAEVIPQTERCEILGLDMFQTQWMEKMKEGHLPVLIVIEGVLMFFTKEQISLLFGRIAESLPGATVLFDAVPQKAIGNMKFQDSVKKYNKKVEYQWGLDLPDDLVRLCPQVEPQKFVNMSDLPKACKFVWWLRWAYKIPYCYRNFNQRLVKITIGKKA